MKSSIHGRLAWSALVLLLASTTVNFAFVAPERPGLPNIDKRSPQIRPAQADTQKAAVGHLNSLLPGAHVDFDPLFAAPKWVAAPEGFLTGPGGTGRAVSAAAKTAGIPAADPNFAAKAIVLEHRNLFGFGPEALDQARVKQEYVIPHSGMRTVVWEQQADGIPLFEAVFLAHTTAKGELVNVSSLFIPDPASAALSGQPNKAALLAAQPISPTQALLLAAGNIGQQLDNIVPAVTAPDNAGPDAAPQAQTPNTNPTLKFTATGLKGPAEVKLIWLPMSNTSLRLCWDVLLMSRARGEMFRSLIDVETGDVLIRRCLTSYISDATYRVFTSDSPSPFSPGWPTPNSGQPPLVPRDLVTLSALDTTASPNGWINDGDNQTLGNNVDAHTDRDNNNIADLPRPHGNPFRVFDFPMDLTTQNPVAYTNAAVVQLFYLNNFMHDKLYELGFNEAAGNFQTLNFGRGGLGNDAVQADAQDGGGFNNANFSTPSDGSPGRMQMYIFNGMTPNRDGDLDADVVLHEYTHGLSNRRVGGGVGISQLQTAGMGEGWSDFYALSLNSQDGDDVNGCYAAGGYASYKIGGPTDTQNYYFGIRRYPYCTDLNKNPLTLNDIDPAQADFCSSPAPYHVGMFGPCSASGADEVHNQGELWCVTLWDARANIINRDGWVIGNHLILQLVTDAMALCPVNPNFLQSRDAIIQADLVYGGTNHNELWAAFAKRGMGFSATSPDSSTTAGVVQSFDVPDDLRVLPLTGFTATGPVGGPFSITAQAYSLTNAGPAAFDWVAASSANWLTISQTSGTLASGGPGASVNISLNASALSLPSNIYSGTVSFTNLTSGRVQNRAFNLLIGLPTYYAEQFMGNNDLAFSTLTFTPNGGPNYYAACFKSANAFPTDPTGGTSAALTDDSFRQVTLTGGKTVSLYGRTNATFFIGSNGYITMNSGDTTFSETFLSHFGLPRISAVFNDLNPGVGGTITYKQLTNRVAVTYSNVPHYGTSSTESFQVEWFFDGRIAITYLGLNWPSGIAGLSAGNGTPPAFNPTDLDSVGSCLPPLAISVPPSATEGDGVLLGAGLVTIPAPLAADLSVSLASSDSSQVSVNPSVTIPAGQTSAAFDLTVIDDALLDGTQIATITASSSGYQNGFTNIAIYDNETATLSLTVPADLIENQPYPSGLVSVSAPVDRDVAVALVSSNPSEIQVPAEVIIPAGQSSASFGINVIADTVFDGTQNVTLTAHVQNWTDATASINVHDDTTLRVALPASAIEGDGLLPNAGAVQLAANVTADLVVSLYSSNLTEIALPPSVTISNGHSSASFDITVLHNPLTTGDLNVPVGATATGFNPGLASILVRDFESLPVIAVDDTSVGEGDFGPTNAVFNVHLDQPSPGGITVSFATTNGSALAGVDYLPQSGSLTFTSGVVSLPVSVPVLGNTAIQPNRSFSLRLFSQSNAALGRSLANATIVDDDSIPGRLNHFAVASISSPQQQGVPFPVQIFARDGLDNPAPSFSGSVALSAAAVTVYTNNILGSPAPPSGGNNDFTIGYSFTPNVNLTVTQVRHYFGTKVSIWDNAGNLIVSQPVNSIAGTWLQTPLAAPVQLNANTTYRIAAYTAGTNYYFRTDLSTGFPNGTINQTYYTTGDAFPTSASTSRWPYVDLVYTIAVSQAVALSPTVSSPFSAGAWTGSVIMSAPASNIVLFADDGAGHTGAGSPFDASANSVPAPGNPFPANGSSNILASTSLAWTGGSGAVSNEVYFGTSPVLGPADLLGNTNATTWNLPLLAPLTTYYWQIISRSGPNSYYSPVWNFTTRGVDHFLWGTIPSPQYTNISFPVTISAVDNLNRPVGAFNGPVALSGWAGASSALLFGDNFEDGNISDWSVGAGLYQRVVTNGTAAGGSYSLTLIGGSSHHGDGVSHALNNIAPGNVTFYVRNASNTTAGGYFVFGNSIVNADIAVFFYMKDDGTMGIFEDVGGWHSVPYVGQQWYKITLVMDWNLQRVDYYVNDALAIPAIPFRGNISSASTLFLYNYNYTEAWWDEIQFSSGPASSPVAISPTTSGTFNNGAWTGNLTVSQLANNMFLRADDSSGHSGSSSNFNVVAPNDLVLSAAGAPAQFPFGGTWTNTLTLFNTGPSDAIGVFLTNSTPGASFLAATASQGTFTQAGNQVLFNIGTLPAGSTAQFTVAVTPLGSGTLTNTATVTRSGPDAIPGNNTAQTTVQVTPSIHHFAWNPISSPQVAGAPFPVQIFARNAADAPALDFNGPVTLSASSVMYSTNNMLGNPAVPTAGSFNYTLGYSFTPATNIIVTQVRHYFGIKISIWDNAGNLIVAQPVNSIPGTWRQTPLAAPVQLNANTTYRIAAYTGGTNYYFRSDLGGFFPNGTINQSYYVSADAFPTSTSGARWPYVDLVYTLPSTQPLPISPTTSGAFVNGSWTGMVSVLSSAPAAILLANDGASHLGASSPFVVLSVTPPTIVPVLNPSGQLQLSVQTVAGHTYYVEYKNDLADPSWVLLQTLIGNGQTQTAVDPASGPQRFYRVRVQ